MRFARFAPWLVFLAVVVLAAVWEWSPLHERFSLQALEAWGRVAQESPTTALWILLGYTVGGLLAFPHGLLIWATAFLFSPWMAIAYCEGGTLCSGLAVYFVGRMLSKTVVERLTGPRLSSLRAGFANKAIESIILLHVFMVVPFTVLNLAAGCSGVRLRDFLIGTFIGVTPGIVVVCLFGHQLLQILHHPNAFDIGVLVAFVALGFFLLRRLKRALMPADSFLKN